MCQCSRYRGVLRACLNSAAPASALEGFQLSIGSCGLLKLRIAAVQHPSPCGSTEVDGGAKPCRRATLKTRQVLVPPHGRDLFPGCPRKPRRDPSISRPCHQIRQGTLGIYQRNHSSILIRAFRFDPLDRLVKKITLGLLSNIR